MSVKYSINRINLFSAATCNFYPIVEMSLAHWVMTFMSASRKLIINEDLATLPCARKLPTNEHMLSICSIFNTYATYVFHCIYPSCALRFKTESADRQFPSNCLFIQAMIVSICFLKLLFTFAKSHVQAQHAVCVDSSR